MHPSPFHKSKWLLILTIGFLTIFVSIYSIQFLVKKNQQNEISVNAPSPTISTPSQTPSLQYSITDTTDGKMYTDKIYGFSVTVPKEWFVRSTGGARDGKMYPGDSFSAENYDPDNEKNLDIENMKLSDAVQNPLRLDVGIDTKDTRNLEEIKNELISDNGFPGGESIFVDIDQITQKTIASKDSLSVTYKNKSIKSIHVLHNNAVYNLNLYYEPTEKNEKLFDQILSTFKFFDQTKVANLPQEIKSFPLYPNAIFVRSQAYPPCPSELSGGYTFCNETTYIWQTPDDGDTVRSWYQNNYEESNWTCGKGGTGQYNSSRDFDSWSTCKANSRVYGFVLQATASQTTITLGVRN